MQFTLEIEYATRIVCCLAGCNNNVSAKKLCEATLIPMKHIRKILLALHQGGYLRSQKGRRGGYMLAKPPESISLYDVCKIFLFPAIPMFGSDNGREDGRKWPHHEQLEKINIELERLLGDISFSSISGRQQ